MVEILSTESLNATIANVEGYSRITQLVTILYGVNDPDSKTDIYSGQSSIPESQQ